jgi:hypothetical protein
MTIALIQDKQIKINKCLLIHPITIDQIIKCINNTFRTMKAHNENIIYTFDNEGIYLHINKNNILEEITIEYSGNDITFYPKIGYKGEIEILGHKITDYDSINTISKFTDIDRNEEEAEGSVTYSFMSTNIAISYNFESKNKELFSLQIYFT